MSAYDEEFVAFRGYGGYYLTEPNFFAGLVDALLFNPPAGYYQEWTLIKQQADNEYCIKGRDGYYLGAIGTRPVGSNGNCNPTDRWNFTLASSDGRVCIRNKNTT